MRLLPVSGTLALLAVLAIVEGEPDAADSERTIAEYLLSHGFAFQEHKVLAPDGYITTVWRIPEPLGSTRRRGRPVLLQHGIFDTGFTFLFQDIHKNLPMMLGTAGHFDIWISNARGNIRSLEHTDPLGHNWADIGSAFWDFSWDDMGLLDLPAVLNHIRRETGYEKVKYVCHSQGCTMLLALLCEQPQFVNEHVEQVVFFAPAIYIRYYTSPIVHYLLDKVHLLEFFHKFGIKNALVDPVMLTVSKFTGKYFPSLWLFVMELFCGPVSVRQMDPKSVPMIAANELGGTSLENLVHWTQEMTDDILQHMDFGREGNLKKYGQPEPPTYNVANVKLANFPSLVYAFENDTVVPPEAVLAVLPLLPEGSYYYELIPKSNHMTGFWDDVAHEQIYPKIVNFFSRNAVF
jgi:pimeloyl-ACP methyl ester carboxylesterase